jgi:hypothetical protein
MLKDGLSKELLELIVLHINSVELLEVLLLLQSNSEQDWTLSDIDDRIRSNSASIVTRLSHLMHLGFVRQVNEDPARYRYMPKDDEMRRIGNELVTAYQTRRVEIIELIYTKPMKEILSFSSSFKFKGGPKKSG